MPISKFAKRIADQLITYLNDKNTSRLPEGYEYDGKDNEALIAQAEMNFSSVAKQGVAIVGNIFSIGLQQGSALFSSASPISQPQTPPNSVSSERGSFMPKHYGPKGVDRAVRLAKLFGLLNDEGQGQSVVDYLKLQPNKRDLFGELGFNLLPNNILPAEITREDCQNIKAFVLMVIQQPPDFARSELVEALIKVIIEQANILEEEIAEEKSRIGNTKLAASINIPSSSRLSVGPPELYTLEHARLKLIYEWTFHKERSLPADKAKESSSASSSVVTRMYQKSKSAQSFTAQGSAQSSACSWGSAQSSASASGSARSSFNSSARSNLENRSSARHSPEAETQKNEVQFAFDAL